MNNTAKACIFLTMAMSIAGSAVVAGKLMVTAVPVFLAAALGLFVGLLLLLPLALMQARRAGGFTLDRKTHAILLLQALCGVVLYRVCMFLGLRYTTAASAGLVGSAAPAIIALLAFLVLREPLPGRRLGGIACVSLGVLAVNLLPFLQDAAQAKHALTGNLLVLAAVVCESVFSAMSKARCRPMPALFRTAIVSFYAFVCLLPFAVYDASGYDFSAMPFSAVLCIGYYGVFVSFLSYVFWFKGVAGVPAGVAGAFTGFVPVSGVFLSWLVLGEPVGETLWIGLGCVLAGIALCCLPKTATLTRPATEPVTEPATPPSAAGQAPPCPKATQARGAVAVPALQTARQTGPRHA